MIGVGIVLKSMFSEAKTDQHSCNFTAVLEKSSQLVHECFTSMKDSIHKCHPSYNLQYKRVSRTRKKSDITQHKSRKKHQESSKSVACWKSFFIEPSDNVPPSIEAEGTMIMMLVKSSYQGQCWSLKFVGSTDCSFV